MSVFLERFQLGGKKKRSHSLNTGKILGWKFCFSVFFFKVWFESFHSSPVGYLLPLMSFLASPVSDAQHERNGSLSKRNRNGKIRRCQECQGQQKFTSFKFTPMWELEINLRQSMWVHSLLYLPATQAVFPGVEPMEWGWRWGGKIRQCSLGAGSTALQAAWKRMGAGRATSAPEWAFGGLSGAEQRDRQPPNP